MQSSFPSTGGASQVKCSEGATEWDNERRLLVGRELLALLQSGSQLIRITQGSAALTAALHPGLSYNAASPLKAGISRTKPLASRAGAYRYIETAEKKRAISLEKLNRSQGSTAGDGVRDPG